MNTFRYEINKKTEEFQRTSKDIRILYVLDGQCVIERDFADRMPLEKADFILLNPGDSCRLLSPTNLLYAVLFVDYYYICNEMQDEFASFIMDSRGKTEVRYQEFRHLLQDFLISALRREQRNHFRTEGLYHLILDRLTGEFSVRQTTEASAEKRTPAEEMRKYIHNNFKEEISLNKIAADLYLSPSAASRIFQKAYGEKFASYVRRIRLEAVKEELVETDLSVTAIALRNGFEVPSSMTRIFRQEFGISPSEFRERSQVAETGQSSQDLASEAEQILEMERKRGEADSDYHVIRADLNTHRPWEKWNNRVMVLGPIQMLTMGNIQNQILYLANKLKIKYIYVWSPFSPKTMVRGEEEDNFSYLDIMLDFCVDHKLRVMLDLSQRKEASKASPSRDIYSIENDTIFQSAEEWERTLSNFLRHITRRYGQEIVSEWIYEFTFFLNDKPYYQTEKYSARTVWEKGYSMVKKYIPEAKVAGPGLLATEDRELTQLLIRDFLKGGCFPDIFTFMVFPYQISLGIWDGIVLDYQFERSMGPDVLRLQIDSTLKILEKMGFRGEAWTNDWGISISNRNFIQDSCCRGAFILKNVLWEPNNVNMFGVSCATDLTNIYRDTKAVLCGSSGILSRNGIPKPACYAFEFLGSMGDELIAQTEDCVITAKNDRDMEIICYNYQSPDSFYFLEEENSFSPETIGSMFARKRDKQLEFVLTVPEGEAEYLVRQKIVNEKHGSVLNQWISFACYEELNKEDVEYMRSMAVPEIELETLRTINENLRFSVRLKPNEMRLISIKRI